MDPSSRKRSPEPEDGRDDDKKRHASDKSPLPEPSFANYVESDSESELEYFLKAKELSASNFPPQTTELELMSFFGAAGALIQDVIIKKPEEKSEEKPEENPEEKSEENPEEKPQEKPEEKSEVKTKKVVKIWFESRQAKKEAFKRNGEKMNGVPIYLTRVPNKRIVLLVEDLDTNNKSESYIKDQLRNHFSVYGNVYKIYIPKNDIGGCLSFACVFLIQNISKLEQMENLLEIDGHEIKLSDYTFQARFRDIKAKMEAEGSEVPEDFEDEEDFEDPEDEEDEGDGGFGKRWFGNYAGNLLDNDEDDDEGEGIENDVDEEDDEMDSEEDE